MTEAQLLRLVLLAFNGTQSVRLFRNSVGVATDRSGQHIRFGLCRGSSDLIGFKTENGVARFVALECKAEGGRLTEEQKNFLRVVREAGGIAAEIRSVEEARRVLFPLVPDPMDPRADAVGHDPTN